MRASFLFPVFALLCVRSIAQQNDLPLQRDLYIDVDRNAANREARIHTGLKPVIESRANLTNVMGFRKDSAKYYYGITEKIFRDHLFEVKGTDYRFTVDPLFGIEYGFDKGDVTRYPDTSSFVHNTRGFWIKGDIGGKVSFQTMFLENQALVPQYLFAQVAATGVLPGQGRVKIRDGRKLDFGWSQANVSFAPVPWLNVQLGHGKQFVGHGYRSVLLSDNASNAPFLKFSVLSTNKRWQYTTWSTKLVHGILEDDRLPTGESSESIFYWMRGRFHHLSLNLGRAQVGLFESTLFRTIDGNGVRPFDPMELNPLIGVNTAVFGFNSKNKSLVGLDLRVKATDKAYAYGQFAVDGPDRYAWQAGIRAFDVLRKDLHLQVEYNSATPYMYMYTPARLAYMNAGQPMAHPLGNAFDEIVAIVDVGFGRFWFQGKVNLAHFERDVQGGNTGTNLNVADSEPGVPDAPIVTRDLTYLDANASYLFNPNTNLRFMIGVWRRDLPGASDGMQSTYIYVALRTTLFNRYYDL